MTVINFIADIKNAQLFLPSGNKFSLEQPAQGITTVTATNVAAGSTESFVDFYDEQQYLVDPDLACRELGFNVQVGEQRSRGIEFDVSGEILPGWNIIANYAFTDSTITKDNTLPVGDELHNVAKHSASLWTTYEIQSGSLQGLSFGVGVFYVGERYITQLCQH